MTSTLTVLARHHNSNKISIIFFTEKKKPEISYRNGYKTGQTQLFQPTKAAGDITIPSFKLYYRAIVMAQKKKHTDHYYYMNGRFKI